MLTKSIYVEIISWYDFKIIEIKEKCELTTTKPTVPPHMQSFSDDRQKIRMGFGGCAAFSSPYICNDFLVDFLSFFNNFFLFQLSLWPLSFSSHFALWVCSWVWPWSSCTFSVLMIITGIVQSYGILSYREDVFKNKVYNINL